MSDVRGRSEQRGIAAVLWESWVGQGVYKVTLPPIKEKGLLARKMN